MADVLTKEQRHKNMINIHGKDTKIEVILRKALWDKGYTEGKRTEELHTKIIFHHMRKLLSWQIYGILQ